MNRGLYEGRYIGMHLWKLQIEVCTECMNRTVFRIDQEGGQRSRTEKFSVEDGIESRIALA